jgi:hypothetical protein
VLPDIQEYNASQQSDHRAVCDLLAAEITKGLRGAESKIWHAHPVWFLEGNPIVGYSSQKAGIRLMFWSGADFGEPFLNVLGKKFKDASVFFNHVSEIRATELEGREDHSVGLQEHRKEQGAADSTALGRTVSGRSGLRRFRHHSI